MSGNVFESWEEDFVKRSLVDYFVKENGFELIKSNTPPLKNLDINIRKENSEWRIECKGCKNGNTDNVRTDFNTGIGQIVEKMDELNINYAIAMPDIKQFNNQAVQIPKSVRKLLNLYWIWVRQNGEIYTESP